jgi:hypothetical protein
LAAQSALGDASTWLTWQSNPQWDPMMMGAMLPRWFGEGEPMEPDAALLRAARVSYLLLKARVPMAEPWRRLAENADLALWELPGHPPVARGYRRFAGLRTDAPPVAVSQALKADVLAVSLPDSVRREEAFRRVPRAAVSHDGTFPIAPAPIEATSRRLAADRIAIEIDAGPQPAMVSISEAYHPWWHARVDGGRVPVVRANLALMAVAVDPGVHRIELRFERPVLLRIAEGVTAAAWIGLVATLLVLRIRSRRDALR